VLAEAPGLDPAAIDEVIMGVPTRRVRDNRTLARMCAVGGMPFVGTGTTMNDCVARYGRALGHSLRAIKGPVEYELALAGGGGVDVAGTFWYGESRCRVCGADQTIEDTTSVGVLLILDEQASVTTRCRETAENGSPQQFKYFVMDSDAFACALSRKAERAQTGRFGSPPKRSLPLEISRRKQQEP